MYLFFHLSLIRQLREPLTPGRSIECQITSEDWVRDVRIDRKLRQLVALCDEGVIIIDYVTNKQKMFVRNWHQTALTWYVIFSPRIFDALLSFQIHTFF